MSHVVYLGCKMSKNHTWTRSECAWVIRAKLKLVLLFFFGIPKFFPHRRTYLPIPLENQFHCHGNLQFHRHFPCLELVLSIFYTCNFFFKDVFQILCIMTLIHYQTQSYNRPCQHQTACWAWYSGNNLACAYSHQTQDTQIAKAKSACSHSNWSDLTLLCGMTDSTL